MTIKNISKLSLCLFAVAAIGFAQTVTTSTTLNGAITRGDQTITLTSSTGVSAASGTNVVTGGYIDREYITFISRTDAAGTGNVWNVKRGVAGLQTAHTTSAVVWVSVPGTFDQGPNDRAGSCTASSLPYMPLIEVRSGNLARCISSRWVVGINAGNATMPYTAFSTFSPANPIATSSVTQVAGTTWFSQLFIPVNSTLTGACVMNGATVATDKYIVALYSSTGVLLASSAVAGTTTATASKYQCIAFTLDGTGATISTVQVAGPLSYFIAIQTNGTTDNFQAYATGGAPTNYGTQSQTGSFGTLAAMTTPTVTFTTAKGPLMMVY